ncbi:MAG: radical SAM protein [Candidatus Omnitrophota bacterium]
MKPSIIFLFPVFTDEYIFDPVFTYHLGAGYIIAFLKQRGIYASQFVHPEPINLEDLANKVLNQNPAMVGFTCLDFNYYFAKLISSIIKNKNPDLPILFGGPTATFSDEMIMWDNPAIDICVRGEGEITTYELIKHLQSRSDISNIPGITYRFGSKLVRTADRPLINSGIKGKELDILPSPFLSKVMPADGTVGILTSRGCIFKCVYCNFAAMSRCTIRYHSVKRIVSELKMISRNLDKENKDDIEDRGVAISDDIFTLNLEKAKQLCREIIEEKLKLAFWGQTRADKVDRELLSLMKQAGFFGLNFGLESAAPRILFNIKKLKIGFSNQDNLMLDTQPNSLILEKQYVEKVKESVKLAKAVGLEPSVSIILGLPGATIKDDKRTINFVRKLKLKLYFHNHLFIFPGTELFKTCKNFGIRIKTNPALLPFYTKHTYNVSRLKPLNNAEVFFQKMERSDQLMRMITGEYNDSKYDGHPVFILRNRALDREVIRWSQSNFSINPIILFEKQHFNSKLARKDLDIAISAGMLFVSPFFLAPLKNRFVKPFDSGLIPTKYETSHFVSIAINQRRNLWKVNSLEFYPFTDYSMVISNGAEDTFDSVRKIVFSLNRTKDIDSFIALISHSNRLVLEGALAKQDCFFIDECRWSERECPAVKLTRLIVGKDSFVKTCFHGGVMAKVGMDKNRIIKDLQSLWCDTKKKRGCKNCPVKSSCSKCLFPYPLDSSEYCRIRRKIVNLDKIIKIFKAMRELRRIGSFELLKIKQDKILCTFDDVSAVININKKKYTYNFHQNAIE